MNSDSPGALRGIIAACVRLGIVYPTLLAILPARLARRALAAAMPDESHAEGGPHQLLVDVSEIVRNDAGTGIQRVVRNILQQLHRNPPSGYVIAPVYASRRESYRYAGRYLAAQTQQGRPDIQDGPVQVRRGDVFLGLDLAAHLLPHHHATLGHWKESGVRLHVVVYDLLPVRHPEWFNSKRRKTFRRWLRTLAIYADGALCISRAVATDLEHWLLERHRIGNDLLPIHSFQLGAEIPSGPPNPEPLPVDVEVLLSRLRGQHCILMVGTIEPRKGYAQVLSAFELIWETGRQVHLLIVGKSGWKVEQITARLRNHPEAGARLHWFESADDSLLQHLYALTDGLVMASEGEGFGLPVIEAARFGKPLLVRDIPVFREVAGTGAQYFTGTQPEALALSLSTWLDLISTAQAPSSQSIRWSNWEECTRQLVRAMQQKEQQDPG